MPLTFYTVVSEIAARQHGILTRRQLLDAGLGPSVIDYRVAWGVLRRVHRGVYRFGPWATPDSVTMAACLACGPGAVASHESAAVLHGIRAPAGGPAEPEVTVVASGRRRPGIRIHRIRRLGRGDVTRVRGVPSTTVERTLCDLSSRLSQRDLERALAEALALRLATSEALEAAVRRWRGRPGAARLREAVGGGGPCVLRSELEGWLNELVSAARLPPPDVNARALGFEVDFLWRSARVVVETDGFAPHRSRRSFERDRERDAVLTAAGYRVMRVTWRKLRDDPGHVLTRLVRLLREQG